MGDVVNFNKARKTKLRSEREARAAENRAKHGRPKSEKSLDAAKRAKSETSLDGAKRD